MTSKKNIILCVTSDIAHDQRILRISKTLRKDGFLVKTVGRTKDTSQKEPEGATFLRCIFQHGVLFYLEYNIRLFLFLRNQDVDIIVSNDVDTMIGAGLAARFTKKIYVHDAHEYFSQVPELIGHPIKQMIWSAIERYFMKYTMARYTVGQTLVNVFEERFNLPFQLVRNVPTRKNSEFNSNLDNKIMLYQGALNEGRGIETYLESLVQLKDWKLWLVGGGDLTQELKQRAKALGIMDRIVFYGKMKPEALQSITEKATVGLNLLEGGSLNYYYSLANKFFDYVQAGVPSINMAFPEYNNHLKEFPVGLTMPDIQVANLVSAVKQLEERTTYNACQKACQSAKEVWNWENESDTLLDIYNTLS